jgi:L-aminopeptidase/D-esterase-like protein
LKNLLTDISGVRVGHADDAALASGVTAIVFDSPAVASIDIRGGGPGLREDALLQPEAMVEAVDAITLSGGSALGLDAAGGVQAWLAEQGRGLRIRDAVIPIVPGAICFDLLNGGNKVWGRFPPYRDLGYVAAAAASTSFALGSVGAGLGATTANFKGGLGSASAQTGMARAIYPVHAPTDGDVVFAAATGKKPVDPLFGLTELGMLAANVVARAIARGVHDATALPFLGALPAWRDRFG